MTEGNRGTGHLVKTDLYELFNYAQFSSIAYPKESIVEALRDFFKSDSYYHYQADQFGFPLTQDHTGLPQDAGLHDNITSRLYIGEAYRFDVIMYPALLVRSAGSKSVPTSFNRDKGTVQWRPQKFIDGYGNEKIVTVPDHFIHAGAWQGSVTIEVLARSPIVRDELSELVAILFIDARFDELKDAGIVIMGTSIGSPTESDDRNDKLYRQTITLEIRTEWRRHIPIDSVIDSINFCISLGNLEATPPTFAPNLKIATNIELINQILEI